MDSFAWSAHGDTGAVRQPSVSRQEAVESDHAARSDDSGMVPSERHRRGKTCPCDRQGKCQPETVKVRIIPPPPVRRSRRENQPGGDQGESYRELPVGESDASMGTVILDNEESCPDVLPILCPIAIPSATQPTSRRHPLKNSRMVRRRSFARLPDDQVGGQQSQRSDHCPV